VREDQRVEQPFALDLGEGTAVPAVRLRTFAELDEAVGRLGLSPQPVLVVVGGASGMQPEEMKRVERLFTDVLAPLAERLGATVVDGGTDAGVMRLMGDARAAGAHTFSLIGAVVDKLADYGGDVAPNAAALEPHHTHFVLVPGSEWGEEAPWLARLASVIAEGHGSATVLVNGGEISWNDVASSVAEGRRVVVLAGSGRAADELAAAETSRAQALRESRLVRVVRVTDADAVATAVATAFGESR
jgi:hypothetical protein